MILIASRQEKELIQRLRSLDTIGSLGEVGPLTAEVVALKRQIAALEITKSKIEETHAMQERELRHMIGLEKKRQEVELVQAKKETELSLREGNLEAERKQFEAQLKFNTERFEKMETYLKDMMGDILERLPNVNLKMKQTIQS